MHDFLQSPLPGEDDIDARIRRRRLARAREYYDTATDYLRRQIGEQYALHSIPRMVVHPDGTVKMEGDAEATLPPESREYVESCRQMISEIAESARRIAEGRDLLPPARVGPSCPRGCSYYCEKWHASGSCAKHREIPM